MLIIMILQFFSHLGMVKSFEVQVCVVVTGWWRQGTNVFGKFVKNIYQDFK